MKVVVDTEKFDQSIEPFLPIIEKHAQLWEEDIWVDAPATLIYAPPQDQKLRLHIFSVPRPNWINGIIEKIFGIPIKRKSEKNFLNIQSGNKLPELWKTPLVDKEWIITSFDDNRKNNIAIVWPNNIYICFDLKAAGEDESNDLKNKKIILDQILEETIPQAIKSRKSLKKSLSVFTSNLKFLFHKNADLQKEFFNIRERFLLEHLRQTERKINDARIIYSDNSKVFARENLLKEALLETLNNLNNSTPSAEYGLDFEMILKMPQIAGIKIDSKKPSVIVYTKKIISNNNRYDIGEWMITIDLDGTKNGRESIHFEQGSYIGKYIHPHAQYANTCFGHHETLGLNNEIHKLYDDGEIFRIIIWCIFFLEDVQEAGYGHQFKQIPDFTAKQCEYKEWDVYASATELQKAHKEYIEIVKNFKENRLKNKVKNELKEAERKINDALDKISKARISIKYNNQLKIYWEKTLVYRSQKHHEDYAKIAASKEIADLQIDGALLRILFVLKNDNDELTGLMRIMADFEKEKCLIRFINNNPNQYELKNDTAQDGFWTIINENKFYEALIFLKNYVLATKEQ